MPDVQVEEKICDTCGAAVRQDTQFCYNCGAAVAAKAIPQPDVSGAKIEKPEGSLQGNDVSPSPVSSNGEHSMSVSANEPMLRSAASLRRKGKVFERKSVEVIWEPAGDRTNWIFVVSTIVLLVFAAFVVIAALYYR